MVDPSQPSPGSEVDKDIEKMETEEHEPLPDGGKHDGIEDEDDDSVFSASRHAEGPRSLRLGRTSTGASASSRRLARVETAASNALATIRSRAPQRVFTHPLEQEKTAANVVVDFDGPDDPYRPINWPFRKKVVTTLNYGLITMGATLATSIYAPATSQVAEEFNVSEEVSTLGTALLLFGFGLGPLLWGPLSEVYGRRPAVMFPYFIGAMFTFGCGAAKDIQTVLICRFFMGIFASAPVTNTGGVLGDIWTAEQRGAAIVGYSMTLVGGPTLGPIIGGAICDSHLRWRWTQYITGIYMLLLLAIGALVLDESSPPRLLVAKARRLRYESGNWALHAKFEEWDVSVSELAHKYLVRPFQLIATPICALVALYASFCYGILYASLGSIPFEFEGVRGWNKLVGALPFLAMLIGVLVGAAGNLLNQRFYVRRLRANEGRPVPEARLPPMMAGSLCFTAGMFVFAWTSDPRLPWIAPCIGIGLQGAGFLMIFQAAINYLIDTFTRYAASAVAANTFLRSSFAGAFPLFITPVLRALGVAWGVSIFAIISCFMIPIPYLFYIYGKRIRARGTWSKESVYGVGRGGP